MAKRKNKSRITSTTQPKLPDETRFHTSSFSFASYASTVGVHTTLLTFTALFVPRTHLLLTSPDLTPSSSRDKPQHPFLDALTINPVATLAWICAGTFILQGWWGGWYRNWAAEIKLEGTDQEGVLDRRKVKYLRNAWLATFAFSFILHIVIVLFGAPISDHHLHNYLLALLLALLTVFTPSCTLGIPSFTSDSDALVNRFTWIRLFTEFSIRNPVERALVYPAVGAYVGCWAGAIPIALDWDRPWQAWPLTPAFGAIFGYIVGSVLAVGVSIFMHLADVHPHLSQNKIK